ncbi:MAG: diguanylate cyclase [Lachnotalea sp.]
MEAYYNKQSILIVDDSAFHCKYLLDILQGQYEVRVVGNGRDAIAIACSDDPPDLILLDVVMPDVDGYEVCKRLKSIDMTSEIPIIFITGKMDEADEILGFELGAVDYISKPFNPIIVKARVNTHMKLKRYRDYLESMSYMDGLTKIPNRRKFDEYYELMWSMALRENKVISIIMIDIDYFKLYNDRYGHQMGDECLIQVAQQLAKTTSRKTDFVGRYGGEEFVCVLPSTQLESALAIAEKMRIRIIELQIPHEDSKVANIVTISLGVASCIPRQGLEQNTLIQYADKALYYSKEHGRNQSFQANSLSQSV